MGTRNRALRQFVGSTIVGSALAAGAQAADEAAIRVVEDPGNSVKLQIAVRTYQTPEATGPTVSLVGVSHPSIWSPAKLLLPQFGNGATGAGPPRKLCCSV